MLAYMYEWIDDWMGCMHGWNDNEINNVSAYLVVGVVISWSDLFINRVF